MRIIMLALFLLAALPAQAAQKDDIAAVEAYLKNLKTLQARFTQTSGGQTVRGDFMLKRPGRMRFQYDAPLEDFIVADGLFIYYYDGQMKQQSNTLISKSLADFFLREDLTLSGDVRVTNVRRANSLLQVTLEEASEDSAGALTLFLTEKPMQLKKWRILDAQGTVTEVALSDIKTNVTFARGLFKYFDPEAGARNN